MSKKYELTKETIKHFGTVLYRIKALRDFGNIKKEDLGGFIESESNLSHEGNCWVYGDSRVCGDVHVYGDGTVSENAQVSGNALVFD